MNCKQIENFLPLYISDDLKPAQFDQVRKHLELCENCLELSSELNETRTWLQEASLSTFNEFEFNNLRKAVHNNIANEKKGSLLLFNRSRNLLVTRWAMTVIMACCLVIAAFNYFSDKRNDNSGKKKHLITKGINPGSNVKVETAKHDQAKISSQGFKRFTPIKLPIITPFDITTLAQIQDQFIATSPPLLVQQAIDPANDIISTENMLRVQIQTADPNIKIIWFVPSTTSVTK